MKYCADTWFVLKIFLEDSRAAELIQGTRNGMHIIIFPAVIVAESHRKLAQKGVKEAEIISFFDSIEASSSMSISPLSRSVSHEGARISRTFGVPLIDSLVAAACKLENCNFLLSGDEKHLDKLAKRRYIKLKSW